MQAQLKHYQDKLNYEMDPADLFIAIEEEQPVVVIDTRQSFGYEKEHIPSALNLPHRTMNEATTANLDKSLTYVCYCDGIGCNGSTKGALNMTKLGFKVKELIGGLEWWKKDGYATKGKYATSGELLKCAC